MKRLFLAVIALCFSIGVNAACTRNDLTGTWVVYSTGASEALRCTLTIPQKGNVIAANCLRADGVTSTATASIVSFDTTCHLTSSFVIATDTTVVDAYVSKGKDSMSGMWVESYNGNLYSGAFNGSKQ